MKLPYLLMALLALGAVAAVGFFEMQMGFKR